MAKIEGFYELYKAKFNLYVNRTIKLLEIGVQDGSSIQFWKSLSERWDVWGLDIDLTCEGPNIVIGDQKDKDILTKFYGFDIIIDDGGHSMSQQITSFKELFPYLNSGGIYVIEDLHTSFWPEFLDDNITTYEFLSELCRSLSNIVANDPVRLMEITLPKDWGIYSIEFFESIVFIYKK
jgi:hypothetical protein